MQAPTVAKGQVEANPLEAGQLGLSKALLHQITILGLGPDNLIEELLDLLLDGTCRASEAADCTNTCESDEECLVARTGIEPVLTA